MRRRLIPLLVLASMASFAFVPASVEAEPDPDPFPLGVCVYVRNVVDQCAVVDPSGR